LSVAQVLGRTASLLDEAFEDADGLIGVDRAGRDAGERLAGVLVGDVEDLDRPAISGLVEEEVERPDLIRPGGGDRARRPRSLLAPARPARDVQALVTPQSLYPLAVTAPTLALEQHVHAPVAVAGMTTSEHVQLLPQQRFVCSPDSAVTLR
jgi:hypothetical protein